jgi:peptide/nickel transport system ATP-binding protein/oligopeptide transport system ATP-binding protein
MTRNNTAGFNEMQNDMESKHNTELLSVENLSVVFETDDGTFKAVDEVSFEIAQGESVGLVGESGCGKSVTALSILGLVPSPPGRIAAGAIRFNGENMLAMPADKLRNIRGKDISMIFQEPLSALSPLHRIGNQLIEAIRLHREMPAREAWAFAETWLRKVGIPDAGKRMFSYPFELSGGMQQRVMIAMALMLSPRLIIADEPTTALDVTTQSQIFELIRNMKRKDTSLLLITHDMGVIWEMCDRVMVMYASRIVESGARGNIFYHPVHPYTIGLLNAIPKLTLEKRRLNDIPGQVPSPLHYPLGCHFEKRCGFAFDRCRVEKPILYPCSSGQTEHRAACFLADRLKCP